MSELCDICGEELGDEPIAEVVTIEDMMAAEMGLLGEEADISIIIHQSCFDPKKYVIA